MISFRSFDNKAQLYDQYRPTYSIRYKQLLSSLGINRKSCIADIGAGTGKHSEILSQIAGKVYCVDPNKEMLSFCRERLSSYPDVHYTCSSGEHLPFPDNMFDCITVAQAFHMLDQTEAKSEFLRIIKPNGLIILTWQSKDHRAEVIEETEKILISFCPDYCRSTHAPILIPDTYESFFLNIPFEFYFFKNDQKEVLNEEIFVGRTLSASYALSKNDPRYEEFIDALCSIFRRYSTNGALTIPLSTTVFVGKVNQGGGGTL